MTTTQRAFEAAMLDFKDKLKGHSFYDQIIQTTSIEQVYQDIQKLQDKQAKSGRLRHLSRIEPFLARLREYSSVVETFVQAKPDILSLIWGPIKLLLLWVDVLKQSFDALVNALEEIGNILPDFCELAEMFTDNNRLQELLVLYFRDILQFYLISTKFFSMRRLRVLFEMFWPSHRDRIQVVVKHMASHRDLIRKEVRMEDIRRADELRNRELQHFVQTEENNIAQEYASHRAHISPKSYDGDLYRFSEAVCNGTGKWLFRDLSFQNWLAGKEKAKPILWLRGIPGAGKTLLASSVIKYTQSWDGTHTVFAFLTYLDSHISALSILHSLIFQLASTSLSLKTMLCQSDLQHLGNDFNVAATLFQTLIQSVGVVYVIMDGLDEVELTQRSRLIRELVRLSGECEECHILLASRAESDISRDLNSKTINIQVDKNNAGSIQVFINQTMGEWFKERGFVSDVRHQLQGWAAPLASRAKGMFLYVKVIFRIIYYINDIENIQNQLEHLPTSLEDAYGRVLQQIHASQDPQRRKLARSILGWVGCAPTPMTLKEIEQALLVNPDHPFKQPRVQAMVDVVRVCGPIVDVVDGYVQFVHFTVREYIFSTKVENYIPLSDMALDLAIRCMLYLCQDHHQPDLTEDEIDANILWGAYRLDYFSSRFWLDLINQYLTLSGSATLPNTLFDQLRILFDTRQSEDHTQTDQGAICLHPAILALESQEPALRTSGFTPAHSLCPRFPSLSMIGWTILLNRDTRAWNQFLTTMDPNALRAGFWLAIIGVTALKPSQAARLMRNIIKRHGAAITQAVATQPKEPPLLSPAPPENLEDEEIQPLMFDLIESEQVETITSLMPRLNNLDRSVQRELSIHGARMGSFSVLQLFHDCGLLTRAFVTDNDLNWKAFGELAEQAVRSEIIGLSRILLYWISALDLRVKDMSSFRLAVKDIIATIIAIEAEDLFILWSPILGSGFGIAGTAADAAKGLAFKGVISTTKNNPNCERMMLDVWERFKVLETIQEQTRHRILSNIASSTCSINLARYALDHGCWVDDKSTPRSLTALQMAARNTTEQAAKFMEFLLVQGADPHKRTASKRIGDEKGAQQISRWLGLTWEQLVEKTTKERQEA
ncbi:hypothetical protein ACKLNR_002808 [Fusarium oxysporum f. sp. zingiberi]